MYELKREDDQFEMYELRDTDENSWFKIAPERGAIVTEFGVRGKNVLYLDKDTFYDKESNVRGGIPILFPISGQLHNGEYELDGHTYRMKQHGFARTSPWSVVDLGSQDAASITLRLDSTAESEQVFPFDFELLFRFALKGSELTIYQEYRNRASEPMPMYAGFHPYFLTSTKELIYVTDAGEYLDYNDNNVHPFSGKVDMEPRKESVVLQGARVPQISFDVPDRGYTISMKYGPEFRYVVLWSVSGKDFMCVEPWMAKAGEMNAKKELVLVDPGSTLSTFLSISCV